MVGEAEVGEVGEKEGVGFMKDWSGRWAWQIERSKSWRSLSGLSGGGGGDGVCSDVC